MKGNGFCHLQAWLGTQGSRPVVKAGPPCVGAQYGLLAMFGIQRTDAAGSHGRFSVADAPPSAQGLEGENSVLGGWGR